MGRTFRSNSGVDRSNTVRLSGGQTVWVAPSSLQKHRLKNGQVLSQDEWGRLGSQLAMEWVAYVASFDD